MLQLLEYLLFTGQETNQKLHKFHHKNPTLNPLPHRLSMLLKEFTFHLSEGMKTIKDKKKFKTHMSIVFRGGGMIHEMYIMVQRTENIPLGTEMGRLEQGLKQLAPYIVKIFGYEQALYIVTPHYQQLADMWG